VLTSIEASDLDPDRLAAEIVAAHHATPAPVRLDLDGADTSARIIAELAGLVTPDHARPTSRTGAALA
jgi:predicted glycosyltransferase